MEWTKMQKLLLFSAVLRFVLIIYGDWQDTPMEVRYTYVDYIVFSDAASLMASGASPYQRSTYRYSPLLAFLHIPNSILHRSCGKFLLSASGKVIQAAFWYGIVVHFRICPKTRIVFAAIDSAIGYSFMLRTGSFQTVAFVAFNKVITAQYFVWFFCLLPLIIPWSKMKMKQEGLWCMGAQRHWLLWGYLLEFKGNNVFLHLWLASILFLAANTFVSFMFIRYHTCCPMFKQLEDQTFKKIE